MTHSELMLELENPWIEENNSPRISRASSDADLPLITLSSSTTTPALVGGIAFPEDIQSIASNEMTPSDRVPEYGPCTPDDMMGLKYCWSIYQSV